MPHIRRPWTLARRLTALSLAMLLVLGTQPWFPWFRGTTTGTRLFDIVVLSDPLAALEQTLATRHTHAELLWGAALLTAVAVVLGPVFCGWVCPLGFVLDLNDDLRRRLRGWGVQLPEWRAPKSARFVALGLAAGLSFTLGWPVFQTVSPINFLAWGALFEPARRLLVVVAAVALVEYFAPRLWCRRLCPLGALYSLLGRFALLRVRLDPRSAVRTPCRQCTTQCPLGIRVVEDYSLRQRVSVDHPDCTRCGNCLEVCPRNVMWLGFRVRPGPASPAAPGGCPPPPGV